MGNGLSSNRKNPASASTRGGICYEKACVETGKFEKKSAKILKIPLTSRMHLRYKIAFAGMYMHFKLLLDAVLVASRAVMATVDSVGMSERACP